MRKKLGMLLFVLAVLASAGTDLFSPKPAEAACWVFCCPDLPSRCITCCRPGLCEMNCP